MLFMYWVPQNSEKPRDAFTEIVMDANDNMKDNEYLYLLLQKSMAESGER